jgi:cell division protein FtsZ
MASGENRAVDAAQKAISSPLLVDTTIDGAQGVLINITGGKDVTLHEVSKASELIHSQAHPEANIIFGTVIDEGLKEMVKVTVIATGFDLAYRIEAETQEDFPPMEPKTPPPFKVQRDTPPYLFEPKGSQTPWDRPSWEKKWEPYETPSFIRKNKTTPLRKTPDEIS